MLILSYLTVLFAFTIFKTQPSAGADVSLAKHVQRKRSNEPQLVHNSPLAHIPKCTLFAAQNFVKALFSISLGTAVTPRRNEKQRLCKIWGGQKRSIMGDVQMGNTDSLLQIDENAHEQVTRVTILLRNASRGVR